MIRNIAPPDRMPPWYQFLMLTAAIALGILLSRLVAFGVDYAIFIVKELFLTALLSMVFIYLISPLVALIERMGTSRVFAITLAYSLLVAVSGILVLLTAPNMVMEFSNLQHDIPIYIDRLSGMFEGFTVKLQADFPALGQFAAPGAIMPKISPYLESAVTSMTKSVFTLLSLMVMVPLFSFFLLLDGQEFKRTLFAVIPNRYFEMTMDMMNKINIQLRAFIRGRVIEAVLVGLTVWIGLLPLSMKYAGFLAFFAGLLNLVPYIGPIIGMAPGLLIAMLELDSGAQIAWVFILYIFIAQIIVDTFILIPILISKVANLHPLIVFLAIIVGGQVGGIMGMIIGVPVVNIASIVVRESMRYLTVRVQRQFRKATSSMQ